MSFSMAQVKRKSTTKSDNIKKCLNYIRSNPKLTENTSYAIWKYADYRFNKRNHSSFTSEKLQEMVEDLMVHIFNKPYDYVSKTDIITNENRIIEEIGRAIYYGAIYNLYYTGDALIDTSSLNLKDDTIEPTRLPDDKKLEKQELEDYFRGLVI